MKAAPPLVTKPGLGERTERTLLVPSRLALLTSVLVVGTAWASVPPPSETPARVVVSGRTTTAIDIAVVKVDQEIPETYAGEKAHNTAGFAWYVSEHYALKSDMGDDFSREMLEISELAYPQWVALTGLEPPDPAKRMYIVYGSSRERMAEAMEDDIGGIWTGPGGGVTIWSNLSAYNYPSGTLKYHRRDLVVHENLHMLHAVTLGNMGTENMTYAGANHVYDEARKQLTVACFDKATINNPIDEALAKFAATPWSLTDRVETIWQDGGGDGALYQQFLWTDPDRALRWRLWRDAFYDGQLGWRTNREVMESIFGPLEGLEAAWQAWVAARRNTFHHVQWGWEQSGDTLWSYGWPWNPDAYSQMDLLVSPSEPVVFDPLRMDYPAETMPPIVGPLARGGDEPSVGCVVDFRRDPDRGLGGLGLGVDGESHCPVVIDARRQLLVGGYTSGIAGQAFAILEELREAAATDGHRFGLTVKIAREALEIAVRAGEGDALREMRASVPLTAEQRERLMTRRMAIIAKGGYQGVTPYIDDARQLPPDLTVPAPANRWRFAGWERLAGLTRAAYLLGEAEPDSLRALRTDMLAAVDRLPDQQAGALAAYEERVGTVVEDIAGCAAAPARRDAALCSLAGVILRLATRQGTAPTEVELTATLACADYAGAVGELAFEGADEQQPEAVSVEPGGQLVVRRTVRLRHEALPAAVAVIARLSANGRPVAARAECAVGTSLTCWRVAGPFDNPGGGATLGLPDFDPRAVDGQAAIAGLCEADGWRGIARTPEDAVTSDWSVDLAALLGQRDGATALAVALIESERAQDAVLALGSDDGLVAWLNGEEVLRRLVDRGYAPRQERVPVRLREGANVLLLAVTQSSGAWRFGAELRGPGGTSPTGVHCPGR